MKIERRKYYRHTLRNNEVFILDPHAKKVAMLKDVSMGGMQLRYLPDAFTNDQCALIDIVSGEKNKILISGLSCNMVYDFADLMENGSFSGMDVRRCGVRFNRLTDTQKDRLGQIMEGLPIE
jgi:hypothetical protein